MSTRPLRLPLAVGLSCLLVTVVLAKSPSSTKGLGKTRPDSIHRFVESHCLDCHQGEDAEAGLDLSVVSENELLRSGGLEKWTRVFDRVRDGEMPPPDSNAAEPDEIASFLQNSSKWIHDTWDHQHQKYGRVRTRRLTNLQLERTLQDLLAVDLELASLMPDEQRYEGFTGIADIQSMSHFQLQTHLRVVDAALDAAENRLLDGPSPFSRELTAKGLVRRNPRKRCREPEMIDSKAVVWSSNLVFYGRLPSTTVKEDGWYRIKLSASAVNKPKEHGVWCSVRSGACVSSAPLMSWIGSFEAMEKPTERTFVGYIQAGHMVEVRPADETLKQARFNGGQVGTGEGGPQGVPGVALSQLSIERIYPKGDRSLVRKHLLGALKLDVDQKKKEIRLLTKDPKTDIARQLRSFAARAFRRPNTNDEIEPFVRWSKQALDDGLDPWQALRAGYRAILCSPRFMYFVEPAGRLDDHAIASRLSYMLWNSMPDWNLTKLAREGKLSDPAVLRCEVDRMLQGPRRLQFASDFAAQWLDLVDINFTEPDRKLYRDFDTCVQNAMLDETNHFLASLLEHDASAGELIDSDYTFLNSRLARYYDVAGVQGDALQKTKLKPDTHRGGLLTHGSILKVTANGTNTSPVLRGVWVSERILGVPIPPPPQNVPAVEPDIRGAKTIREQLVKHLADESCAACHQDIDPPGYALENFDAAGRWRDRYWEVKNRKQNRGTPVDASFHLADGREFADLAEFKKLICTDIEPIAMNFAGHLVAYGTGGPVTFVDRTDLRDIVDRTKKTDYGVRSLLHAVVSSPTFLSK